MTRKTKFVAVFEAGHVVFFDNMSQLKAFLLTKESAFVKSVHRATEIKFQRVEDVKFTE